MDTRFLDSFVAVVELGSFAEASRRLNLTPAAVAQRIRALEADLGARLIIRAGRSVSATEAGFAILDHARRFAQDLRDLRTIAAGERIAGELRLGAISTALTGVLPDILSRAIATHSELVIHVTPGTSIDLHAQVMNGGLDAAVVVHPPFTLAKSCDWRLLRDEGLVLLVPAGVTGDDPHRLLATQPFIRYDRNHWGGRLADEYLRKAGLRPRERFELDALEAIAVMVDRGLGVSLVPDWAGPWPGGLSLRKIPLGDAAHRRRVGLIWQSGTPRIRLVLGLVSLLP